MVKKSSQKVAVAATNDSSTTSKCSMCRLGYLQDDFVKFFVQKPNTRRSPIINRGYFIRTWAIQRIVEEFLDAGKGENLQIISLGAGFDTLYFRLLKAGRLSDRCKYIEIDFKSVVNRKLKLLKEHSNNFSPIFYFANEEIEATNVGLNYWLVGCDLRQLVKLKSLLINKCHLNLEWSTLIIAECVLTYLKPEQSDGVLDFFSLNFPDATVAIYEQIIPNDGFGVFMKSHFSNIGSPLRTIDTYPTVDHLYERFTKLGFDKNIIVKDMNHLYNEVLSIEERDRINKIEPFDEHEIWHLKCSHYVLCIASHNIPFCALLKNSLKVTELPPKLENIVEIWPKETRNLLQLHRFGHDVGLIEIKDLSYAVISFGMGLESSKHQRLSRIDLLPLTDSASLPYTINVTSNGPTTKLNRLYHACLSFGQKLLIIGGRRSPLEACQGWLLIDFESHLHATVEKLEIDSHLAARWRCGVCKLDDYRFIVCGGVRDGIVLSDFLLVTLSADYRLDIDRLPDLPCPLHSHTCSLWKDAVVVVGGVKNLDYGINDVVWTFDLQSKSWTKLHSGSLLARYGHTCHVVASDWLLLVGGVTLDFGIDLVALNLNTGSRKSMKLIDNEPNMIVNHSALVFENELVIFGGGGNCFSFGTLFNPGLLKIDINKIWS